MSFLPQFPALIVRKLVGAAFFFGAVLTSAAFAQVHPEWVEPQPPFHLAGPLYYVGSKDLATYLVVTPAGDILINSCLEENVPMIQKSIAQLGFKFTDVKILLISHAHWDHDAGSALVKKLTGARYMVMDADLPTVESGGRADFNYGNIAATFYPPATVDRILHDGDVVSLGGIDLVAHLTPGHTRGCTTWTMKISDGDRELNAVIIGSPNVNPGYKLVGNAPYPQIADDFARTFRTLKALPCDLFLGAHGDYFGLAAKYAKLKAGAANPFIDPEGYQKYITEKDRAFRDELAKQKAAAVNAHS
ncbi:MAG TPA: subclass B3 metallo-beta-lactamase [Opitutus sp.]|nr:subclass B3 metallo-beta-lactamase [Opitutus sp.]